MRYEMGRYGELPRFFLLEEFVCWNPVRFSESQKKILVIKLVEKIFEIFFYNLFQHVIFKYNSTLRLLWPRKTTSRLLPEVGLTQGL